jgi:hypothetical protein
LLVLSSITTASAPAPTKTTLLTLNRAPTSVYFGDEIKISGQLVESRTGQGVVGAKIKLIDNEPGEQKVITSSTTRKYGLFTASWKATLDDPNRDNIIHLMAKFEGSTGYSMAISRQQSLTVKLLPLDIKFEYLQSSYKRGEPAEIIFTVTSFRKLIQPDTVRVSFDGKSVSVVNYGTGNYVYETPPLTKAQHQFFASVSKYGYSSATQFITIHVN